MNDILLMCDQCGHTALRRAGALYPAIVPTHCGVVMQGVDVPSHPDRKDEETIWGKQEALRGWHEQYKREHPDSTFLTGKIVAEKWGQHWEKLSPKQKEASEETAYQINTFQFDLCMNLEDKTTTYHHHVTFEMTEAGYQALRCFIARVPEAWHADFYELFDQDPERRLMIQFFRTPGRLNPFCAASLILDLPTVEFEWNKAEE
jgi:hypothetical protein